MKLTEAQQAEFKALEQHKRTAEAGFRDLTPEALRKARNAFYAERQKTLKEIFTEEQWILWTTFWKRPRNANPPGPTPQPAHVPAGGPRAGSGARSIDAFPSSTPPTWIALEAGKPSRLKPRVSFRTHHDGSRWWLVTPAGHPFLSFGLNHFSPSHWYAPYNREHWMKQFGAEKPLDHKWEQGFRSEALSLCRKLGITALGIHNDAARLTNKPQGAILPYIRRYQPVVLSHYTYPKAANYHDVFAPQFVAHCDTVAKQQALPYKDDPMLIGYSMADAPLLTDAAVRNRPEGATTWPRVLRNLGPEAPGKQAYVQMLRERHNDITALNNAYGTSFDTWQSLSEAENWRPRTDYDNKIELEDNAAFLCLCIDRYYTVAKASLRKVDPNHMFLGDKLGARGDNFDAVIEAAAPHIDIINYGHYGRLAEQEAVLDRWTEKLKKPFLSADGSFAVRSEMLPNPMGPAAEDWAQCSEWTRELAAGLFARPDVVGWNICGVIEVWKTVPGREKKQHQGIMDPFGKIKPGMESAIRDVASRLYHIADSQNTKAERRQDRTGQRRRRSQHHRSQGIRSRRANRRCLVHGQRRRRAFRPHRHEPRGPDVAIRSLQPRLLAGTVRSRIFTAPGQINWQGPGVKRWLDRIAKDHKDYGFNTLAFHHPHTMPTAYCNQLELYYFGKMRMSHVHARRAKTMSPDGKFPDVFDPAWLAKLDAHVQTFTSRHKDSQYLLGYSYDDLPAYTINNLEKRIVGFEHHPWILDIISKPGLTEGKTRLDRHSEEAVSFCRRGRRHVWA